MKLNVKQRSEEWLNLRRTKIGASDVPVIMGTSPYSNKNKLIREKQGEVQPVNYAMQHGINSEEKALEQIQNEIKMALLPAVYMHDEKTFALASLDGISLNEDLIVEIKAPQLENHRKHKSYGIPIYYQQQMQWQMFVTGVNDALFASWYDGDLYMKELKYDESMVEKLLDESERFYLDFMVDGKELSSISNDTFFIDDEIFHDQEKLLLEAKSQREYWEEKEKLYTKNMLLFSEGKQVKGKYFQILNKERRGSLDETLIKEKGLNPDDFRKAPTAYQTIIKLKT